MKRTLVLSVLVAGVALALAAGSYSALAGSGPVTGVAGLVMGVEDPDDDDDADDVDDDDDDGDEADGNEVELQGGDGDGNGAQKVAQALADEFGGSAEDMLALHDQGIGFGAMFKLYVLAGASGMSVDDLMATITADGDGGYEFAFGEMKNALTEEQQAAYESGPKNLGQLMKASKSGDATAVAKVSNGQGPPDHAPAHGRN